jgi:GTPase
MKTWMIKAQELLRASLEPPKHELNELDWKAALSPDKKRLTEHLSALANQPGGGYLVFGVDNTGTPAGVDEKTVEFTVNQLANLGLDGPTGFAPREPSTPPDVRFSASGG